MTIRKKIAKKLSARRKTVAKGIQRAAGEANQRGMRKAAKDLTSTAEKMKKDRMRRASSAAKKRTPAQKRKNRIKPVGQVRVKKKGY